MDEKKWSRASDAPDGVTVETKIDDDLGVRNVALLTRRGRLWFMQSGMYVYYTPTHYRPVSPSSP